jgi:ATP-dependent DNA helicase RecG
MQRFYDGKINILVSTTVVEVGVNVPNATVMVIENAERFGLAQLHQLRGRVGRGDTQSYCFLVSESRYRARLNILCETEDGFKIAEEDLKLRGPGELLGLRQHGAAELKLTDLIQDGKLVEKAYELLQKIIKSPERYQAIYKEVERLYPKEKTGIN